MPLTGPPTAPDATAAPTHPAPADMARAFFLGRSGEPALDEQDANNCDIACGIRLERARVAAHLHAWVASIRSRQPNEGATIVWAVLETFAEQLEGKVQR